MAEVEQKPTIPLDDLQKYLVKRIDKVQERLEVENDALTDEMAGLLLIGQLGLLRELSASGLDSERIKDLTGIMLLYTSAEEKTSQGPKLVDATKTKVLF